MQQPDAKRNASAILALSPSAPSSIGGGGSPNALLAADKGIEADRHAPTLEIKAEDAALTAASQDIITGVKAGDVNVVMDAIRNAIYALHPKYAED